MPDRDTIHRVGQAVWREHAADPRTEVFELQVGGDPVAVHLRTTLAGAALAFARLLKDEDVDTAIRLTLLPDPRLEPRGEALVRAGLASVYRRPTMNSTLLTQYPMGARLGLLERRGRFWRIRGEDGHLGWTHFGCLIRGELEWALGWERAEAGEPMVSLGAELHDEADRPFARLPWGARVVLLGAGRILLPDGRTGRLGAGELVAADRLWDRFPPRGESVTRTARRWLGVHYLWGGVTPCGVDCSGFVQSIYWIHGVALPRDSDMQRRAGAEVTPAPDWSGVRAGDLLFFAEGDVVNHVALSLGGGHIIHAAATNGGVDLNDLQGDRKLERRLRSSFVGARRLLPD
ncbi:MAG: C40 family peptidase [Gemmatimonadota bacterium]